MKASVKLYTYTALAQAHHEAVQGCVKLRRLHTEIHDHHHEKFLPAVIKMQVRGLAGWRQVAATHALV